MNRIRVLLTRAANTIMCTAKVITSLTMTSEFKFIISLDPLTKTRVFLSGTNTIRALRNKILITKLSTPLCSKRRQIQIFQTSVMVHFLITSGNPLNSLKIKTSELSILVL